MYAYIMHFTSTIFTLVLLMLLYAHHVVLQPLTMAMTAPIPFIIFFVKIDISPSRRGKYTLC
jgi:hypothetical protein